MTTDYIAAEILIAATVPTIKKFVYIAQFLGLYATQVFRTVSGLTPPSGITYGRYYESGDPLLQYQESATSVDDLISQGVELRKELGVTLRDLLTTAEEGDIINDLPDKLTAAYTALMDCCATAVDQINIMEILAGFRPPPLITGTDTVGTEIANFAARVAVLIRVDAMINLGSATATYDPTSSTEAMSIRNEVAGLIEGEAIRLASWYDDSDYQALEAVRQAVVIDMNSRANMLRPVVMKSYNTNLPALVIAQQLYGDATRSDEIIGRNNSTPNPGFMPATVEVLAS